MIQDDGAIDLLGTVPRMPPPGEAVRGPAPVVIRVYYFYALIMPILVPATAAVVPAAYHDDYKRWAVGMLPAIYVVMWLRIFPAMSRWWSEPPEVLALDGIDVAEPPGESRRWLLGGLVVIGFLVLILWDWGVFAGRIHLFVFEGLRVRGQSGIVIYFRPAEDWLALTRLESGLRTLGITALSGLLGWIACWAPRYLHERDKGAGYHALMVSATFVLTAIIWRTAN